MLEGPPFKTCFNCKTQNLGLLSIGRQTVERRCRACGWTINGALPPVTKRTVYLDQFAISQIFKLRRGELRPASNSYEFWIRADAALKRAYLLQQVVFPASHIHFKETIVYRSPEDLRVAHDMLAGGVHFRRLEEIELTQLVPFAQAFIRGEPPPKLDFALEEALAGDPDGWLPRFHISVNTDFSMFAEPQRATREQSSASLTALTDVWAAEKPTYQAAFEHELQALGPANINELKRAIDRAERASAAGDLLEVFEANNAPLYRQFLWLARLFEDMGVPHAHVASKVIEFWYWPGLQNIPFHRLFASLVALLARKFAAGQRRTPSPGMLNDFEAIAYFGPYVDAMLLDRECAGLVREMPADPSKLMRAKVFSLASGDAFIAYLDSLSDAAPKEVRQAAHDLYQLA